MLVEWFRRGRGLSGGADRLASSGGRSGYRKAQSNNAVHLTPVQPACQRGLADGGVMACAAA
jgi:hypothetical protein